MGEDLKGDVIPIPAFSVDESTDTSLLSGSLGKSDRNAFVVGQLGISQQQQNLVGDRESVAKQTTALNNPIGKSSSEHIANRDGSGSSPRFDGSEHLRQATSSSITSNAAAGDYFPAPFVDTKKYQPLDCFANPVEMLAVIDPRFKAQLNSTTGEVIPPGTTLHDWQIEQLIFMAQGGNFTSANPLIFNLCACNGSGKDAYVIAPFVVWQALTRVRSLNVITSSSFDQLKTQTEAHIRYIVDCANEWGIAHFGGPLFSSKEFNIVANNTRSLIKLFVTDEEGRVEGYHPFADHPNAEFTVWINEAKTVNENIQGAMKRYTGFNRWINVSSSGRSSGPFYKNFLNSKMWCGMEGYDPTKMYARKIDYRDCPHISKLAVERDRAELGETSSLFRSIYLSEFTSLEEAVMITRESIEDCIANPPPTLCSQHRGCGIDLALGGDENSLRLVIGNKLEAKLDFRNKNAVEVESRILMQLDSWKNTHGLEDYEVNADDGGLGRGIIDHLKETSRWSGINRVMNQSAALRKNNFGNRGAELYFNVKRMIELKLIILDASDIILINQLATRYYRESMTNSKLYLESKQESKAKGHGSPDRADSLVLALMRLDLDELQLAKGTHASVSERIKRVSTALGGKAHSKQGRGMTEEELEDFKFRRAFKQANQHLLADHIKTSVEREMEVTNGRTGKRLHGSVSVLLDAMKKRIGIKDFKTKYKL